jgi:hypothetical protein
MTPSGTEPPPSGLQRSLSRDVCNGNKGYKQVNILKISVVRDMIWWRVVRYIDIDVSAEDVTSVVRRDGTGVGEALAGTRQAVRVERCFVKQKGNSPKGKYVRINVETVDPSGCAV